MKVYKELPQLNDVSLSLGTFDGMHIGHKHLIEKTVNYAKRKKIESCVVSFWPHPRIVLGKNDNFNILSTYEETIDQMKICGVDNLIFLPFDKNIANLEPSVFAKEYILKNLKPSAIHIGYDHRFGKNRKGSIDTFKNLIKENDLAIEVFEVEEFTNLNFHISSTTIRKALSVGAIAQANEILGYNYSMSGIVIKGKQLGRKLGYPTANLEIEEKWKMIPKNGVYYTVTTIGNQKFKSATSIGINPTTDGDNKVKIETYILDFDKEIYGEEITVEFIDFIRNEEKFDDIEMLKSKIEEDINTIKNY